MEKRLNRTMNFVLPQFFGIGGVSKSRQKNYNRIFPICILVIVLFYSLPSLSSTKEDDYLHKIKALAISGKIRELKKSSKNFFKRFPKSRFIPTVRLILAENEPNPVDAIKQYRILVDKYSFYKRRDYAQYKICEVFYLQSRWSNLRVEAHKGTTLFKKSSYITKFKLFLAKANIFLERYDDAKKNCFDIIKSDHKYENLSESLLLLSYLNRITYGLSRRYLNNLRELVTGFKGSGVEPIAIYLLGKYYEGRGHYNKAYSAYIDLIDRFTKSQVSIYARRRIESLRRYKPSKTNYIPDHEDIGRDDEIDIHPEMDISGEAYEEVNYDYSISISFFDDLKKAKKIKNLIKKDFDPIDIVKVGNKYIIYVGRLKNSDRALFTKIRLAEEFALNGQIVRIIKEKKRIYIYGK